jgi:hypothetical protein
VNKFLGIVLIVLAVVMAVVPVFTDCQSQGKAISLANGSTVPMKCHWTGVAEVAVAVPLLAVGAIMTTARRKRDFITLSIIGSILGAFAILLPTELIGVCTSMTSLCNTAMRPVLAISGSLAILSSLGGLLLSKKADL